MEILLKSYRGKIEDLYTFGSIAVVDKDGKIVYSAGDPNPVGAVGKGSGAYPTISGVAGKTPPMPRYGAVSPAGALPPRRGGGGGEDARR